MAPIPFKIKVPDRELEQLNRKLDDVRLPTEPAGTQWGENNGVSLSLISETVRFWRSEYDWRTQEADLNSMPQFTMPVESDAGFGTLDIHFVLSRASSFATTMTPLLFLHGWPSSFAEVQKMLPSLNAAGFEVVAPSLPGFGFSSYPTKAGFKFWHTAGVLHKLMLELGYERYVVHGGDWGSIIGRTMAVMFPTSVQTLHLSMLMMFPPKFEHEPTYNASELRVLARLKQFTEKESSYAAVQASHPRTFGFAMHDSPVGMLAWMADKLLNWSDNYPWTPTELINWTLLHYFPGPTTAFLVYNENNADSILAEMRLPTHVTAPVGISAFPKERVLVPRVWADKENNVVFWQAHDKGGHFPAWEQPDVLANDIIMFFEALGSNQLPDDC